MFPYLQMALSTLKDKLDDICHARIGVETIQPMLEAFEVFFFYCCATCAILMRFVSTPFNDIGQAF